MVVLSVIMAPPPEEEEQDDVDVYHIEQSHGLVGYTKDMFRRIFAGIHSSPRRASRVHVMRRAGFNGTKGALDEADLSDDEEHV